MGTQIGGPESEYMTRTIGASNLGESHADKTCHAVRHLATFQAFQLGLGGRAGMSFACCCSRALTNGLAEKIVAMMLFMRTQGIYDF
jgi:hypothetical protein